MACLGVASYDPAVSASASCAALLAMTALDTTNLRVTFTAPSNGAVLVRLRGVVHGSASGFPRILLGILEGSTVRLRSSPMGHQFAGLATTQFGQEVIAVIPGLTPGGNYTWDAAYGVETLFAATGIKYGGPNNATANDAFGAFDYEVWSTENLLGACLYDPATAVTGGGGTAVAMTAFDTTNLRLTFTAPANGQVMWRIRTQAYGSSTETAFLFGILDGSTVRARRSPIKSSTQGVAGTTVCYPLDAQGVITGLTGGNSYTFDAAYGVETIGYPIRYGGPNDTTTGNAFGAAQFEIWRA